MINPQKSIQNNHRCFQTSIMPVNQLD